MAFSRKQLLFLTHSTSFVGYEEASSEEIGACVDEWFQDSNGVRNITVDGDSQFQVTISDDQ